MTGGISGQATQPLSVRRQPAQLPHLLGRRWGADRSPLQGISGAGYSTPLRAKATSPNFRIYWGAAGEQVDLLSGNLNYSIPLIQSQGRAGLAATFALSYNSQIWRQTSNPNTSWLLGRDLGYGLGSAAA